MASSDHPLLTTLSFSPDSPDGAIVHSGSSITGSVPGKENSDAQDSGVRCLLCEKTYDLQGEKDHFLKHLLVEHKFVIGDIKLIADFPSYLDYWRDRLRDHPLEEFCSVIRTNSKDTDSEPSELYYFLCDALPEDKQIRNNLQQQKLEGILLQQQMEREDESFSRSCLFCKEHFTSNRAALFDHMVEEHNFNVGRPDNLVYCNELLDLLEGKINSLQCLYCEKTFKDRHVLKEHMRKKMHKKINPQNSEYDKFYIINYLEMGKNWEMLKAETDRLDVAVDSGAESDATNPEDEWSDWRDDKGAQVVCLYCDNTASTTEKIQQHMKDVHHFDLASSRKNMTFYQQVKLINYIRRQVHQNVCPVCQEKQDSREHLRGHMDDKGHMSQLPDSGLWDQPQYFFPTYEDDALLFGLEDLETSDIQNVENSDTKSTLNTSETEVIAEDCPVTMVTDSIIGPIREQLLT